MARQGNTTAVGLGYAHQAARAAALRAMRNGTACPLCGHPMYKVKARNWDGRVLHYDHVRPRALGGHNGPRRLTHATCNIRAGQAVAARLRRGRPAQAAKPRPRPAAYTRW